MTNFIPLFPLNIVVYPGEAVNLHIFEPRYKQLVNECILQQRDFGIVPVISNNLSEIGTSLKILSVERTYEQGEMDIKTMGMQVFRILERIPAIPDKLYEGAIVNYPDNQMNSHPSTLQDVLRELRLFHALLDVQKQYAKPDHEILSYDLAHHAGLNLEQEYELLCLLEEAQRQEFLRRHLKRTIPTITEFKHLKKRIEMNGHFRKLSVNDENE